MAKDIKPETLFASWAEAAGTITVPLASIPNLTTADATATTGDFREILFHMLVQAHTVQEGVLDAADALDGLVISRTEGISSSDTELLQSKFTLTFKRRVATSAIDAES